LFINFRHHAAKHNGRCEEAADMTNARYWMWPLAAALLGTALLAGFPDRGISRETVKPLLDTGQTILSQPIAYPTQAPAKIVSAIVTMLPGEETGWHRHDVPMYGYILEGEVTVTYAGNGTHVYRQGDALMEAIDTPHNGRNTGNGPARILAVFMGAQGVPNTEMLPDYKPE
jgi:quercetin dioxygenase-like cupin family protein